MTSNKNRPDTRMVLNSGTLLGAGFCLLVAAGIAAVAVVSASRGDSEFNSAVGAILVVVMCGFFVTFAVALLSPPRLEKGAWLLWNVSVVALLIVSGFALTFQTNDFVSTRSTNIRTPHNLTSGRIVGGLLLGVGVARAVVLARRR